MTGAGTGDGANDGDGDGGAIQRLVDRVAAGDRQARDELAERVYGRVRDVVHRELERDFRKHHRWILPLFSTRDVVQDVLLEALGELGGCEFADERALLAYLSTVVRHRLLDAVRYHEAERRDARRQVDPATGVLEHGPARETPPPLAAMLGEQVRVLQEVLGQFPERHRLLLQMRLSEEATYPEIAAKLGYASAETARQAFCEAQAKLLVRLRARGVK